MSVPVPAPSVASSCPEVSFFGVALALLTAPQSAASAQPVTFWPTGVLPTLDGVLVMRYRPHIKMPS